MGVWLADLSTQYLFSGLLKSKLIPFLWPLPMLMADPYLWCSLKKRDFSGMDLSFLGPFAFRFSHVAARCKSPVGCKRTTDFRYLSFGE